MTRKLLAAFYGHSVDNVYIANVLLCTKDTNTQFWAFLVIGIACRWLCLIKCRQRMVEYNNVKLFAQLASS